MLALKATNAVLGVVKKAFVIILVYTRYKLDLINMNYILLVFEYSA